MIIVIFFYFSRSFNVLYAHIEAPKNAKRNTVIGKFKTKHFENFDNFKELILPISKIDRKITKDTSIL